MTRDKYIQWSNSTFAIKDPEEVTRVAQAKYEELTAGMIISVITHDWKERSEHTQEVIKKAGEIGGRYFEYFDAFHSFPNGELDSIITVISKEEITEEFAEILADLVVNLGAEGS